MVYIVTPERQIAAFAEKAFCRFLGDIIDNRVK